jgi:hypothetical protein
MHVPAKRVSKPKEEKPVDKPEVVDVQECARGLVGFLEWTDAPVKSRWEAGMQRGTVMLPGGWLMEVFVSRDALVK